jgi:hypothetical protein
MAAQRMRSAEVEIRRSLAEGDVCASEDDKGCGELHRDSVKILATALNLMREVMCHRHRAGTSLFSARGGEHGYKTS